MWWQNYDILSKVFFCIATGTTIFMIIQTIMLFFGFGNSVDSFDGDIDTDIVDGDTDIYDGTTDGLSSLGGLKMLSLRGIIAGLAIGGWVGLILNNSQVKLYVLIPVVVGTVIAVMFIYALAFRSAMKLQQSGNIDNKNAIGKTATVYIPILPNGKVGGKVTFNLQERFVEKDAICYSDKIIPSNQQVEITGIIDNDILVVRSID